MERAFKIFDAAPQEVRASPQKRVQPEYFL
jgi:hypothetical protein